MALSTFALAAAALASMARGLELTGLTAPTGFCVYPATGRVYVSGQKGQIWMANSTTATAATLVKDITTTVFSPMYADHGLTSCAAVGSYLYATLQVRPGGTGGSNACPAGDAGCPSRGRVVRFPINTDGTLGDMTTVLPLAADAPPAQVANQWCAQFKTGSVNYMSVSPSGELYVSAGSGCNINDGIVDYGQYGLTGAQTPSSNVCGTGSTTAPFSRLQGCFRSQDPLSWNGKILKLTTTGNGDITGAAIHATGLNNPWRFGWSGTTLAAAGAGSGAPQGAASGGDGTMVTLDTGIEDYEEINKITSAGQNFGFPCNAGNTSHSGYYPVCTGAQGWGSAGALPTFANPLWQLSHPGSAAVISAVHVHPVTGDIWLGDYVNNKVYSLPSNPTAATIPTTQKEAAGAFFPVHLQFLVPPGATHLVEGQMHVADVFAGTIKPIGTFPNPKPTNGAGGVGAGAQVTAAVTTALATLALALGAARLGAQQE